MCILVVKFFYFVLFKKFVLAGHWWLILVILPTWESEIRRIVV
jgi:hypothetical protein